MAGQRQPYEILAKCVDIGMKPGRSIKLVLNLANTKENVRMIRVMSENAIKVCQTQMDLEEVFPGEPPTHEEDPNQGKLPGGGDEG